MVFWFQRSYLVSKHLGVCWIFEKIVRNVNPQSLEEDLMLIHINPLCVVETTKTLVIGRCLNEVSMGESYIGAIGISIKSLTIPDV